VHVVEPFRASQNDNEELASTGEFNDIILPLEQKDFQN